MRSVSQSPMTMLDNDAGPRHILQHQQFNRLATMMDVLCTTVQCPLSLLTGGGTVPHLHWQQVSWACALARALLVRVLRTTLHPLHFLKCLLSPHVTQAVISVWSSSICRLRLGYVSICRSFRRGSFKSTTMRMQSSKSFHTRHPIIKSCCESCPLLLQCCERSFVLCRGRPARKQLRDKTEMHNQKRRIVLCKIATGRNNC